MSNVVDFNRLPLEEQHERLRTSLSRLSGALGFVSRVTGSSDLRAELTDNEINGMFSMLEAEAERALGTCMDLTI